MHDFERKEIEDILRRIEAEGYLDSRYGFVIENDELKLLGAGASALVYEMYDKQAADRHYAAKIIGFGNRNIDEKYVEQSMRAQSFLGEQSEHIMRAIALWTVNIDELQLKIMLLEKLETIIERDKFGNVTIKRDDLKNEDGVLSFAMQIGRAIFTVHNNSFLHRDIKLENIFWDEKAGLYKLGDFGIAKYVDNGNAETILFTDGYGAPEIERQLTSSYNAAVDIYSFGISLYLLLNDLRFPGSDSYRASLIQYDKDYIMPSAAHASAAMSGILRKMCSYQVEDRFQSMEEVLMEIGRLEGSYTKKGFAEDFGLETEYFETEYAETEYAETEYAETEYNTEDNTEYNKNEQNEDRKDNEYLGNESRQERRLINDFIKSHNSRVRFWSFIISSILIIGIYYLLAADKAAVTNWQFWVLPVMVLVEGILLKMKEFYISFGCILIGMGIMFIQQSVISIWQLIVIVAGLAAGCLISGLLEVKDL